MSEPYYELRHRAAIAAMQSLITNDPDHNTTIVAIQATEFADALLKELGITPDVDEVPD